jgi:ADP-ribosylglycohydrolase
MTDRRNIARATLFGVAFGDSLGKPLEFIASRDKIRASGLGWELPLPMGVVTDDTEMTLAVARALEGYRTYKPLRGADLGDLEFELRCEYTDWQDANAWGRAAGHTCLKATTNLRSFNRPWQDCTLALRKGCGANMRVAPIALVPNWTVDDVANIAQLSAGMTHGHPTALAAAELTALAVYYLRVGECTLDNLNERLLARAYQERGVYRDVLGHLADHWRGPKSKGRRAHAQPGTAERAMNFGWGQCINALKKVEKALKRRDEGGDISSLCGLGWIAEDALATSVYAASRWSEYPRVALSRAVRTIGDSDSLGAITGSFLGAALGEDAFPAYWYNRIEYASELAHFGQLWDSVATPALV